MWDLIKSFFGAIFDVVAAVLGFIWDLVVWLVTSIANIAIWIFKNIITFFFEVLADLITKFPLSFVISIAILGGGYYLIDQWQKKNGIVSTGILQNPMLLFVALVPITTLLIGVVAESGPASIVNNTTSVINVGGNVDNGATVQIGSFGGGFLGIPTAIWAAIIAGFATVAAALIALKNKK
jgi:hypothetical protein